MVAKAGRPSTGPDPLCQTLSAAFFGFDHPGLLEHLWGVLQIAIPAAVLVVCSVAFALWTRASVSRRVSQALRDLTAGLGRSQFDLVVSNPPYVEPDDLPTLQPEVRDWEPHVALVASGATEEVARAATEALRPGGWLVLETAAGTGERIRELLQELGYERVTITPDLAGRDRVVEGKWKS